LFITTGRNGDTFGIALGYPGRRLGRMFHATTSHHWRQEVPMRTIVCLLIAVAALTAVVATAGAGSVSSCQTNRTFMQASRNGALPAIYAALHGGVDPKVLCSQSRH
jgi:hypothetical protein